MPSHHSSTEPYRHLSLWWDQLAPEPVRPSLGGDLEVDVAIVGGGFTGLWTARELLVRDPNLRVAVLEAEVCGFGASGRNGGWASALFSKSDASLTATYGHDAAMAMRRAMVDAVAEVGRAAEAEGIDCDLAHGGTLSLARGPVQLARAEAEVADAQAFGMSDADLTLLDRSWALSRCRATDVLGATYTPHCSVLQPAKLARGLATAVERRGAQVYEATPVTAIDPGEGSRRPQVHTQQGRVTARAVVRATEAWSAKVDRRARSVVPIYSLMVATEPLGDAVWSEIGLGHRESFTDFRHLLIYGQRTADGRLAFGGRGAPYHFGSRIAPRYDHSDKVAGLLQRALLELFPVLDGTTFTHAWGGPLGVPRDWMSSVGYDPATGVAWAGGYIGDGVTTTNLAGRTLADLLVDADSALCHLPWVGHRSKHWEPEPLRWLGVNAGLVAARFGDAVETRTGRASTVAGVLQRLTH